MEDNKQPMAQPEDGRSRVAGRLTDRTPVGLGGRPRASRISGFDAQPASAALIPWPFHTDDALTVLHDAIRCPRCETVAAPVEAKWWLDVDAPYFDEVTMGATECAECDTDLLPTIENDHGPFWAERDRRIESQRGSE